MPNRNSSITLNIKPSNELRRLTFLFTNITANIDCPIVKFFDLNGV